jgi:hypothetical protein
MSSTKRKSTFGGNTNNENCPRSANKLTSSTSKSVSALSKTPTSAKKPRKVGSILTPSSSAKTARQLVHEASHLNKTLPMTWTSAAEQTKAAMAQAAAAAAGKGEEEEMGDDDAAAASLAATLPPTWSVSDTPAAKTAVRAAEVLQAELVVVAAAAAAAVAVQVQSEVQAQVEEEGEEMAVVADRCDGDVSSAAADAAPTEIEGEGEREREVQPPLRKALFHDEELEQATSSRSGSRSASARNSLESATAPAAPESAAAAAAAAASESSTSPSELMEEKVLDVLDYLLEVDELDPVLHRRLSSQKQQVAAAALKRFSVCRPATIAAVVAGAAPTPALLSADTVAGDEADGAAGADGNERSGSYRYRDSNADEGQEGVELQVLTHRTAFGRGPSSSSSSSSSSREADTSAKHRRQSIVVALEAQATGPTGTVEQQLEDDNTVDGVDVLNALRSYLSSIDKQAPISDTETMEYQPLLSLQDPAKSARSSTSSMGSVTTTATGPQWVDSQDPSGSGSSSARNSTGSTGSTGSTDSSSGRLSVTNCSNLRVSFSSAVLQAHPIPVDASTSTSTAGTGPGLVRKVMTYPMATLLDDALLRGLVVPSLSSRIETGRHTNYVLETSVRKLVLYF